MEMFYGTDEEIISQTMGALHASSAAQSPRRRRVIHIEYAAYPLPGDLQWYEVVTA